MGRGIVPLILGQGAFPNVGWQILAVVIGVLSLGAQPLLFWLLCNHLRAHQAAVVKELNEWEGSNR